MKYSWRVLVATQFALWALFFSGIIPFSGDILLPVVWILDKRTILWFGLFRSIQVIPQIPGIASAIVPVIERSTRIYPPQNILVLFTLSYMIVVPITIIVSAVSSAFFGSLIIRRKIRRKAPDLWGMIKR